MSIVVRCLVVAGISLTLNAKALEENHMNDKQVRVRQSFKFPVDPLNVTTMSDYDLSLLLFRTWFNYDEGRVALPELIERWTFDEKFGRYTFTISTSATWSDGSKLKTSDLQKNLKRAVNLGTPFGHSFDLLADLSSWKNIDERNFSLQLRSKMPTEALFQRLGSIFLAVVSPKDLTDDLKTVRSNTLSIGPFALKQSSPDQLEFVPNLHFHGNQKNGPSSILVRKTSPDFSLMEFLEGKTWENYVQVTTLISPLAANKIKADGLPYWTRGYDRVSILKPISNSKNLAKRRKILTLIGSAFQKIPFEKTLFSVKKAASLQPIGYPLAEEIKYPDYKQESKSEVTILIPDTDTGNFHKTPLEAAAKLVNLKIKWMPVDPSVIFSSRVSERGADFVLTNVGVADPEPTTWMGLIFNSHFFIDSDKSDLQTFQNIAALDSKTEEVLRYNQLLKKMALNGKFLPLFHFSTLSIGHKGLNFKNIRELDETVNLSKIVLE